MADSRTALARRRSSWLCFSGCSTAFSSRFLHQSIRITSSSPRVPKSTIQPGELSTTPHTSISLPPSPLVINKSGLSGCASGTHYPFPCGVTSHSRLKGCNLIPIFALFPRVCSFHAFPFESSLVTIRCFFATELHFADRVAADLFRDEGNSGMLRKELFGSNRPKE